MFLNVLFYIPGIIILDIPSECPNPSTSSNGQKCISCIRVPAWR